MKSQARVQWKHLEYFLENVQEGLFLHPNQPQKQALFFHHLLTSHKVCKGKCYNLLYHLTFRKFSRPHLFLLLYTHLILWYVSMFIFLPVSFLLQFVFKPCDLKTLFKIEFQACAIPITHPPLECQCCYHDFPRFSLISLHHTKLRWIGSVILVSKFVPTFQLLFP